MSPIHTVHAGRNARLHAQTSVLEHQPLGALSRLLGRARASCANITA